MAAQISSVLPAGTHAACCPCGHFINYYIAGPLPVFYFLEISSVKQEPSGQNRPSPEGRLLPETAPQTEYPAKPDTVILME